MKIIKRNKKFLTCFLCAQFFSLYGTQPIQTEVGDVTLLDFLFDLARIPEIPFHEVLASLQEAQGAREYQNRMLLQEPEDSLEPEADRFEQMSKDAYVTSSLLGEKKDKHSVSEEVKEGKKEPINKIPLVAQAAFKVKVKVKARAPKYYCPLCQVRFCYLSSNRTRHKKRVHEACDGSQIIEVVHGAALRK